MTEKNKIDVRTAELLLATWRASREGKLKVAPQFRELAEEFMSAPLTMTGIVDTSRLSETALSFGRTSGMAIGFTMQHEPETASSSPFSFSKTDFTELPVALIKWGHLNRLKVVVENDQETFFVSGYRLDRLPNSKWRCLPKRRQLRKITEIERHSSQKIPETCGEIRY